VRVYRAPFRRPFWCRIRDVPSISACVWSRTDGGSVSTETPTNLSKDRHKCRASHSNRLRLGYIQILCLRNFKIFTSWKVTLICGPFAPVITSSFCRWCLTGFTAENDFSVVTRCFLERDLYKPTPLTDFSTLRLRNAQLFTS